MVHIIQNDPQVPPGNLLDSLTMPYLGICIGGQLLAAAWGVQFHQEVTGEVIRVWCDWDETTRIKADALVKEFAKNQEKYRASSKLLFENFIAAASLHNLRKKHPSIS